MSVGRQWGMGFLLQSNDKQPSFLWERYKAFFPTAEAKLRAMKPEAVSYTHLHPGAEKAR